MTIFETIGMAWVIFTSSLATVSIVYLAFIGLRSLMTKEDKDNDVPVEVKEMFKVAR